jgi:probable HAF family extracellular repeat protein
MPEILLLNDAVYWDRVTLGTLIGELGRPVGINDAGQVGGHIFNEDLTRAFITGPDGTGRRDFSTFGSSFLFMSGINDAEQMVGRELWETTGNMSEIHAFITRPNGAGIRDLGTLGGNYSSADGVNNAGQVVGGSRSAGGALHAFITGSDGVVMRDLGTLGGVESSARGINDAGQVVGYSETANGRWQPSITHAFITGPDGTGMRDLGTLGGSYSSAYSINAIGQVVGESTTAEGEMHAFVTGSDGMGMRDLGTFGGFHSVARSINAAGQVVGESMTAEGDYHAFITGPNGKGITDLNSLLNPEGIILTGAIDINNRGQILAYAVTRVPEAVIQQVPEPETYALMLGGLGVIGFMARRKKPENRLSLIKVFEQPTPSHPQTLRSG